MREPKQEKLEEDDDEEQTELVWTNTREFTPQTIEPQFEEKPILRTKRINKGRFTKK